MAEHSVFLSIVLVIRNQADNIHRMLKPMSETAAHLASDYEIIVVDNASSDSSVHVLRQLTDASGLPNLQVFALTKEVDIDIAFWAGAENALGDFVAMIDPNADDASYLPTMLAHALKGSDVVFAYNQRKAPQSFPYRICAAAFNAIYTWLSGINLTRDTPQFRILSRRVINFILQHPVPAFAYRYLAATAGFARANLIYDAAHHNPIKKRFADSVDRGLRLLVTSTRAPMRLVTSLSLFGAIANLVYSGYVIAIALWKEDVAPGWVTLSLQQAGMFFLMSLVLLVLSEYILHMARLSNEGPPYHVAQEFTSAVMTRRKKLNVDDTRSVAPSGLVSTQCPNSSNLPLTRTMRS